MRFERFIGMGRLRDKRGSEMLNSRFLLSQVKMRECCMTIQ